MWREGVMCNYETPEAHCMLSGQGIRCNGLQSNSRHLALLPRGLMRRCKPRSPSAPTPTCRRSTHAARTKPAAERIPNGMAYQLLQSW